MMMMMTMMTMMMMMMMMMMMTIMKMMIMATVISHELILVYRPALPPCPQAYNWLRKSANLILNLLSLMSDAGISELSADPVAALAKVEERFRLDLTDEMVRPVHTTFFLLRLRFCVFFCVRNLGCHPVFFWCVRCR